jgi:hypothetical protein
MAYGTKSQLAATLYRRDTMMKLTMRQKSTAISTSAIPSTRFELSAECGDERDR